MRHLQPSAEVAPEDRAGNPADEDVLEAVFATRDDDVVVRLVRDARLRWRCNIEGVVASVGRATGPSVALDVVVADGTGRVLCHFFGRDAIPGVVVGAGLRVTGRLVTYRSRRCLLNPDYELVAVLGGASDDSS